MAYIGKPPNTAIVNQTTSQSFNGTGSATTFTLNRSVNVGEDLEVFVDNVQQEPGSGKSYTASGTTLTFDEAPPSGTGNIYVIYRGEATINPRLEHDANAALSATDGTFTGNLSVDGGTIKLDGNYPTGTNNVALGDAALGGGSLSGGFNVAIGTSALDANTSGTTNIAIGVNALGANTTASDNVAVGHSALKVNTTGASNVAVGYEALDANTTAANNTALGYAALTANTTGDTNVAVGKDSMKANTTGTNNTALGPRTLQSNTTAVNNVAVGDLALSANTTANNNVAVGVSALKSNTTGYDSTAVGAYALDAQTTAAENTAVGTYALSDLTTGNYNTAVGQNCLADVTTGYENTAIGLDAGRLVSTGYSNTMIGENAGSSVTTGANNIIIGHNADVGGSSDINNSITIGIDIGSQGSNYFTFGKANNRVYNQFTSNASWTRSSDERLKTNIEDDTLGLDFINRLRPVSYQWKPSNDVPQELTLHYNAENTMDLDVVMNGFIAQEVKQALDDSDAGHQGIWETQPDGTQALSKEMMIMPLVNAIKELSAKVAELEAQLEGN